MLFKDEPDRAHLPNFQSESDHMIDAQGKGNWIKGYIKNPGLAK